jgi:CBS domain containing-hemolysin-like protein
MLFTENLSSACNILISQVSLAAMGSVPVGQFGPPTSGDVTALIAYITLALLFSFLCSIAEAVLLSVTPSFIESLKETNPRSAKRLQAIKIDNVDRSLAAILTLNTIAHTVGAIGSGAKATVVFGSAWFGVFSAVMTLMILFLSEIVPKTIGAVYWSKLVGPTSLFVQGLIYGLYPIVWLSERVTKLIARDAKAHVFSRDELVSMASIGEQSGQLAEGESRIINNLLKFGSLTARDIMTPRTVVTAFPENSEISQALEIARNKPFSRLPVYRNNLDDITGFVLRSEILLQQGEEESEGVIESLRRDISKVVGSLPLPDLLEQFLRERQHIALVVDEFGGCQGIVTLEDLLETMTGSEIMDELDNIEDMQSYAKQQWKKRAKRLGIETSDASH